MKQVLIKKGGVIVEEVPAPFVAEGHVLVDVAYSLISTGTEISNGTSSGRSLVKRALERPEKMLKLADHLRHQGVRPTYCPGVASRGDKSQFSGIKGDRGEPK